MEARLERPINGERVGRRVHVKGRVIEFDSQRKLWIAHRRVPGGMYWPKEPEVMCQNDGRFESITFEGGTPGRIVISLLSVDGVTSEAYQEWLKTGHETGEFPGIRPTQLNARELASANVEYVQDHPLRVFLSYSHDDEKHRESLEKAISGLVRRGLIEPWHDRRISPGRNLPQTIHRELERADIILLLISSSFLSSDYCYDLEMTYAMGRQQRGEARVVPIIIRACDWLSSPFRDLNALPTDGKPVTSWSNGDEAWTNVALGLGEVIKDLR